MHLYKQICVSVCIHTRTHTRTQIYIHIYIYIFICICIDTDIYMYMHTYNFMSIKKIAEILQILPNFFMYKLVHSHMHVLAYVQTVDIKN